MKELGLDNICLLYGKNPLDIRLNTLENDDRIFANIQLNGISARFECDSGSRVSIINIDDFKKT